MKEFPPLLTQCMEYFGIGAVFILVNKITTSPLTLVKPHGVVLEDYSINQEVCVLRVTFGVNAYWNLKRSTRLKVEVRNESSKKFGADGLRARTELGGMRIGKRRRFRCLKEDLEVFWRFRWAFLSTLIPLDKSDVLSLNVT